jgi:hypothetical protein
MKLHKFLIIFANPIIVNITINPETEIKIISNKKFTIFP